MDVVTPDFLASVVRSGPLAEARLRAQNGSAQPRNKANWDRFSSWALICEEVLDTEHAAEWYDDIFAELGRRGFTCKQIDAMRRFAWATAGWLNFDRMLWEWCTLDEKDIKLALEWQLRERVITQRQYDTGLAIIERPDRASPTWPLAGESSDAEQIAAAVTAATG